MILVVRRRRKRQAYCAEMESYGARDVACRNMALAIVALHGGVKPPAPNPEAR